MKDFYIRPNERKGRALSNCALFLLDPQVQVRDLYLIYVLELGWEQLSTGNLCRKHISEQTSIGKQIDFAIKSGKLISDRLMTDMVDEWLSYRESFRQDSYS